MNVMDRSLNELHVMLKTIEQNIMGDPMKEVRMVKAKWFKKGHQKKHHNQGKGKLVAQPMTNTLKMKVITEHEYFYYKERGIGRETAPST